MADASVGIAWAAASQSSQATIVLLDELASGRTCFVPVLWMFEVANSLLVLTRRGRISHDEYTRARRDLSDLHVRIDYEGPLGTLGRITDLAQKHSLTIYDATYLDLALRKRLPLASRDAALNKAAKRSSVETLLDGR